MVYSFRNFALFPFALFVSLVFPGGTPGWSDDKPLNIESRRELFVESSLIADLSGGAELRLHHPIPREVAMVHDAPWEGTSSGYHTVFQDGDLYRMYYRGLHLEVSEGKVNAGRHEPFYCYAESRDGIKWSRPELGIVEFDGSKKNNIILKGVGTHNFAPFKDHNPDAAPDARYKGLGGLQGEGGLSAFKSPDGIHWSLMREKPVITNGAFDSQNLAFWDSTIKKYRAYWRYFTGGETTKENWKPEGLRAIRTGTSSDFLNWSETADLAYVDSPPEQLYTNQINPYFRAPHIQIGFPTRYIDRAWSESMRALPDLQNREIRASTNQRYGTAMTEVLLMASRDGVKFKRWNEAFMPPGIERPGTWQYGHHYAACHAVETKSALPGAPNEMSIYATENYWHGKGGTLRRYTLRLDGFVSVRAPMTGGELITRPLLFSGDRLELNFSTSAAGGIRIGIENPDGTPIDGFALDDCPVIFGDSIQRAVPWKGNASLKELSGKPIRLRIELKDADLYSFQFVE